MERRARRPRTRCHTPGKVRKKFRLAVARDMKVVGMIPARAGSRRLPGKNLVLLAGRPLVAHTCAAALESGVLDAVYVNTDCERIASAARDAGVGCPALRPAALARHETPTREAVIWMLDRLAERGERFDVVMILQPTSPLRSAEDIRAAWRLYQMHAPCRVTAVCVASPENWFARRDASGRMTRLNGTTSLLRINGAIYIHDITEYRTGRCSGPELAYVMPPERSIDIDTQWELDWCEWLLSRRPLPSAVLLEHAP